MIRARPRVALFKFNGTRHFCNNTSKSINNGNQSNGSDKIQSDITKYDEAYGQLDKLDFMTAAKMLFSEPPKPRKFGIDFHLVQLFFACLPSLAVYLVAQYARREMRTMDAELERKKKEEEEKAKEMELKAVEEKEASSDHDLLEVKVRLDKLEEAVKEIAVEAKKQSDDDPGKMQEDGSKKKHVEPNKSGDTSSTSESSKPLGNKNLSKQKSIEPGPGKVNATGLTPRLDASRKEQNSNKQSIGTSEDATKK